MEDLRTQRPLGYWLKHIDGAIEAAMARLFAADDLTRRGWQVLNTLSYEPITPSRIDETLAPFLSPAEPSTRPYVDALVHRGWARPGPADTIQLTAPGHAAHRRIAEQVTALRSRVTESLSPEEYGTLLTLLRRVADHLDATEPRTD
ncbi:MarR family winged helix-turn-helix transcriptional regulator [Streptomyces fradiae]|uniref:MarR family winged helix-turn-helix transcriptional regulator n=1 Tax=Streptomyces fradiae TaxID=1906 RepID=UPI0035148208